MRNALLLMLILPMLVAWDDTEEALRDAGAEEWEILAVKVMQVGSSMGHLRQLDSIIETDCGAFGVFHLQPHQSEEFGVYTEAECPFEDKNWRRRLYQALITSEGTQNQLGVWRSIIGHIMREAEVDSDEELGAIAAIANSSPSFVLQSGRDTNWDVVEMLNLYLEARPNSDHRRRRVNWIRENLLGLSPLTG